ncbi:hypothetical protein WJX81_006271 [Elliptochloris bilobata]|uniref:Uncharacterized protein n=1 Tax=Elliptochloris bilobata TaxID=381761 RepID=A0AAW1RAA7_9CHLO
MGVQPQRARTARPHQQHCLTRQLGQHELCAVCSWAVELDTLAALCSPEDGADREYLAHVLKFHGLGSVEAAAQWLLDTDLQAHRASWRASCEEGRVRRKAEQERETAARKQTLAKFMLQPAGSHACGARHCARERAPQPHAPAEPERRPTQTVRYREGCITSTRGEKYVIVEKREDWNGGSTGKVKTKGKRGKGFV